MDIGYVFILYYGLERHLLEGDFHSAFNVILKLRDAHKNKSFQSYSGNALILSALLKEKGGYIPLFIKSLDNEYEFIFSDNLLLMSYYSFNVPLLPKDILRMAKTFEFTNTNYIKKNPDILEPLDEKLLKEPRGMTLLENHYFYEDQIHAFYKRRNEDQKYIDMTIAACEKQIAIAKDVAKKMLAGKKRYALKTDSDILVPLKKEMAEDLAVIEGTDAQKEILDMIDRSAAKGVSIKLPNLVEVKNSKGG